MLGTIAFLNACATSLMGSELNAVKKHDHDIEENMSLLSALSLSTLEFMTLISPCTQPASLLYL